MKRFFVRKFVFEGKTEWLNPFIALIASMFILSVFLLGFYNSRSSKMYEDSNAKESKAILDTAGFVANFIFNTSDLRYSGDPATPAFRDTPVGYQQAMKQIVGTLMSNDRNLNSFYVGDSAGSNPNDSLVAGYGVYATGTRYPEANVISLAQNSLTKSLVIVRQEPDSPGMSSYFKAFSRRGMNFDTAIITRLPGWKFNFWTKFALFLGIFAIAGVIGFLVSRFLKHGMLQYILLIALLVIFSIGSFVLVLNMSKGDYGHNSSELCRFYNMTIKTAETTIADNFGYQLADAEKEMLVLLHNADIYGDIVDGFIYNPATGLVEEQTEAMKETISVNNVFIFIGWLIGLVSAVLSIIFLAKRQGVERFLNTLYNFSTAYLFILPGILGMLILVFIPIIFTLILGFTSLPKYFTEINLARNMAGFSNFGTILGSFNLRDPRNFYYTLGFTILYSVVSIGLQVVLGVLVAVVLHQNNVRMKSFYQVAFMLPWIIPTYISGIIWNYFFTNNGVLDQFMNVFSQTHYMAQITRGVAADAGMKLFNSGWFGDPVLGFFIVSFVSAWYAFPFIMLVTLSALQTIPKEIHEAALIDGASWFQSLFGIILPMIRPTVLPSVLLTSIWTFNNFNLVYLVTGGRDELDILVTRIYDFVQVPPEIASQYGWTYGYAAAYSSLIFIILLVYIYIFARASKLTEKSF